MNRTFRGATALVFGILVAAPARAQAPLVVGSVRDQHGAAIVGAVVTGETLPGARTTTTTDASGTFALHANGIVSVLITCRYCRSARVAVKRDEPVVLVMLRYDALANDSPSPSDLENLPYAHVESSIALHPFTLLSQSSEPYPGALLSDRGLSPTGSLLIDDGAPNYDIVNGQSPYVSDTRIVRTKRRPARTQPTLTRTVTKPPAASSNSIPLRADRTLRSRSREATRSLALKSDRIRRPSPSGR